MRRRKKEVQNKKERFKENVNCFENNVVMVKREMRR